MLEQEFEYFKAHQTELAEKYQGKVVVIRDQAVVGVFADELSAVLSASKSWAMGTFLVQRVERGPDVYTQVFHSRAAFA